MSANAAFERTVAAVIVLNTALLVASVLDHAHEELLSAIETGCLVFFVGELLARLRREGWRFLRSGWGMFDSVVITLALMPILGVDVSLLRVARLARLVHLGRHITHLRLLELLRRRWRAART